MDRREFLSGCGTAGVLSVAGCLSAPKSDLRTRDVELPDGPFKAKPACEPDEGVISSELFGPPSTCFVDADERGLSMTVQPQRPTFGEVVRVQLENTTSEELHFGGGVQFTVLRSFPDGWREVLVSETALRLSAVYGYSPGDRIEVRFEPTRAGLVTRSFDYEFCEPVESGVFAVVLGTASSPHLTAAFTLG